MKILHISFSDISGGAARASNRIHKALLIKGLNSKMLVSKKQSVDQTILEPLSKIEKMLIRLRPRIANLFIKLMRTKNSIPHSISFLPSQWVKRINDSDTDIVHLHWVQHEMLSISDIGKIKKPIVWTLHDMWAFCGAEHYTNDIRWREGYNSNNRPSYESGFDLNKWTWDRKKKYWKSPIQIITPSSWLANCVRESKLMSNWPVSIVANPINTEVFKPMDKKTALKNLNLPNNVPLLLFGALGGIKDTRKGFDLLIKTLKHLKNKIKVNDIEIVILGQSKPNSSPNLDYPIHYMGHLNDDKNLCSVYNSVDALVIPSRQDNLPNMGLEAQACGVPVIAFNTGGLGDIIDHQKTGYLAKAFDVEDLGNGIIFVLEQSKKKQLASNAREQAIKKFSEKKISEDYLKIYKNLLI